MNSVFSLATTDVVDTLSNDISEDTSRRNEVFSSEAGSDTIYATGDTNVILAGVDYSIGNSGKTIFLSNQPDTTNHTIDGTAGRDAIATGSGRDIIYAGEGDNEIACLFGGNKTIYAGAGDDLITTSGGNDVIYAGEGNNYINAGDGRNIIYAYAGNDSILTGAGNDIIYAGGGNNTINSGVGNDIIYTGSGNDYINASLGNDIIWLQGGQDTVVIALGNGVDTINNFQLGQTQIGLSGGLTFNDLTIAQGNGATSISAGNAILASLSNVQASSLDASSFVTVTV